MRRQGIILLALTALVFSLSAFPSTSPARADDHVVAQVAKGTLRAPSIDTGSVTRTAPTLSTGMVIAAAEALRQEEADMASGNAAQLSVAAPVAGRPGTLGCGERHEGSGERHEGSGERHEGEGNVRVNQDCSFRRQAEEGITFNPTDRDNLVAGQNDSRVGFNQCGIDWSTDNGAHWGDLLPPFRQKINNPAGEVPTAGDPNSHTLLGDPGTGHTYDAASDPGVAFDSQGNTFFDCVAFDVNSNASMLYVVASPAGAQGSFFFNIPTSSRHFIVAEDNNPAVLHDKPFIAADFYPGSPNRDNVYVTWTVFRFSPTCKGLPELPQYCSSPIFGSLSTDHGRTWSTPQEISGTSDTLCFLGNLFDPTRDPHACDFDQGSDPKVLPNGDLEVIFNNANTAPNNPNAQQLGVLCHPSGSSPAGTAHLNCGVPSKVGDDIVVAEPQCDFGRGPEECIPGAYIRTNDFPRLAVNRSNGDLYATWQDYRNGEYDIQLAQSLDGGRTWTEVGTVNPDRGLDHYFPAIDLAEFPTQDRVGDSYYRTERVPNENTTPVPTGVFAPCGPGVTACQPGVGAANSDYVLAGGRSSQTPYDFRVLSPVFPPPDGIQSGFNGDYSGLAINTGSEAHPIWSDTRNVNPYPENGVAHDEDIFTVNTHLPAGQASLSTGEVGER